MFKMADRVLDSNNDSGYSKLNKLLSKRYDDYDNNPVDMKKELADVNVMSPADLELLPDNDFALIYIDSDNNIIRRFPRPDVDNAIISALYLIDTYKELPYKAAAIAANNLLDVLHGPKFKYHRKIRNCITDKLYDIQDLEPISEDMVNIYREGKTSLEDQLRKGQLQEIQKVKMARKDLNDDDFVFITKKAGKTHRLFPINDVPALLKQANYFSQNENIFSLEHRHQFAKRLRDKSASLGVKIASETLSKYASNKWSPTADANVMSRIKALTSTTLVKNEKTGSYDAALNGDKDTVAAIVGYKKLLKIAGSNVDKDTFAVSLHRLDKACGLDKCYGKTITNPYTSTFQKQAFFNGDEVDKALTSFAGKKVSAKDLARLNLGDVVGVLDSDTFDELIANPIDVFNSLPNPYKSVILEALESSSK